jgi:predicted deacylase
MSLLPSPGLPAGELFPADYRSARERWRGDLERTVSCRERRDFPVAGQTPQGTALATDCGWLGAADASRVLVVISGTHGVEGYAGSAVQFDLLNRLPGQLPENLAILCIHALNPWGYAWHRRCDAEGIDLNRNFIDFSKPLPANPGYRDLRTALFDDDPERRARVLERYRLQHGQREYEIAVSGGQYNDPVGPFYGGSHPACGRRTIEALIREYRLAERELAVVDVHTGLGEYGHGEIICDHAPDSGGAAVARRWYGTECTLPALGTSSSVPKLGLIDYAWHAIMGENSCFITLEFGTLPVDSLFGILLEDHRFRARYGLRPLDHPDFPALVAALRAHFCPDEPHWRQAVVQRARQVIDRALEGLLA